MALSCDVVVRVVRLNAHFGQRTTQDNPTLPDHSLEPVPHFKYIFILKVQTFIALKSRKYCFESFQTDSKYKVNFSKDFYLVIKLNALLNRKLNDKQKIEYLLECTKHYTFKLNAFFI